MPKKLFWPKTKHKNLFVCDLLHHSSWFYSLNTSHAQWFKFKSIVQKIPMKISETINFLFKLCSKLDIWNLWNSEFLKNLSFLYHSDLNSKQDFFRIFWIEICSKWVISKFWIAEKFWLFLYHCAIEAEAVSRPKVLHQQNSGF